MRQLIGFVFIISILSGCGGSSNETQPPSPVPAPPVLDTVAPVITIAGENPINHEQGTAFVNPTASAIDDVDGAVNVSVDGVVADASGTYTLTYSSVDATGNQASVTLTVIVADTTAPVITLNGSASITINQNDTYSDAGATALDLVDGVVTTNTSGSVNTSMPGTYVITYTASDNSANQSNNSRTIVVQAVTNNDETLSVFSQGAASTTFDAGLNAFDSAIGFSECSNDGGGACPSINWRIVNDDERSNVLEIEHANTGDFAGFFIKTNNPINLIDYENGALLFDIKTLVGDGLYTMKLDCVFPCTSGDQRINFAVDTTWNQIIVPLGELRTAGLDLTKVDTGIVIWATGHNSNVFQLDNIRFVESYTGNSSIAGDAPPAPAPTVNYSITQVGKGSISDTINPASYKCVFDFGNWIYSAGVVSPGVAGCDTNTQTPQGNPSPLLPQTTGEASEKPFASHRWWGSVSFMGEMMIGAPNNAAYITPDPITARVSNTGFRMMGIPNGLNVYGIDFGYRIPDPFAEVFDGIAIANTLHRNMQAYAKDSSDGSVTVEWQANEQVVMHATFVHGSPYVFIDVLDGDLQLRTLRDDGGEKGLFYSSDNSLGVWTNVANSTNYYLITGENDTSFVNSSTSIINVSSNSKRYTVALMPSNNPSIDMISLIESMASNRVAQVNIDYNVNQETNSVDITHQYLDENQNEISTLIGMQPLHWKNVTSAITDTTYQVRSARGITKFANNASFTYQLPHVGVLPALPTFVDTLDSAQLTAYIDEFLAVPASQWSVLRDTYWSGKDYGKVAELIAIADSLGLETRKQQLFTWLKAELEDWFTAETNENLDIDKYFVYDENWDTLLGMEESFASHQQLNDHHFHYGYFVRAAAEICRHEASWCDDDNYGAMVKMLIRDYAGGNNDPLFPYLRHFDPANGFSWASGNVNFARGNNNESTSEAANAYGALILFGLITGDQDITDRGIYLHASTAASYWEYWNNIDGYRTNDAVLSNFPSGYNNITTSIIWGDGAVFSTWFSGAFAHILGIQGLPMNALNLHIGIHAEYLDDYVTVGLTESSNGKPSGLVPDQWRDIWWNIWSMTDADAAIQDYESVQSYVPEAGETKAHTYHWIHTFKELGEMHMGTGELTADYPAAVAFEKDGAISYVVYNYSDTNLTVNYSDGTQVNASPNGFTVVKN